MLQTVQFLLICDLTWLMACFIGRKYVVYNPFENSTLSLIEDSFLIKERVTMSFRTLCINKDGNFQL